MAELRSELETLREAAKGQSRRAARELNSSREMAEARLREIQELQKQVVEGAAALSQARGGVRGAEQLEAEVMRLRCEAREQQRCVRRALLRTLAVCVGD